MFLQASYARILYFYESRRLNCISLYLYFFYLLFLHFTERQTGRELFQKEAGSVRVLLLDVGAIRLFPLAEFLQSQQLIFVVHVNLLYNR
jgi:hypothetical protein